MYNGETRSAQPPAARGVWRHVWRVRYVCGAFGGKDPPYMRPVGNPEAEYRVFSLERGEARLHPRSLASLRPHEHEYTDFELWGEGVALARAEGADESRGPMLLERVRLPEW